jgi:hypothetical protein
MNAYDSALHIDADASPQRLQLAASLLADRTAVVLLCGRLALRAEPERIVCEVLDPYHGERGSEARYRRLIEEAKQLLASSPISAAVRDKNHYWCVVDDYGMGTAQLWPTE